MPATPSWPPRSAPRLFVDDTLDTARILALREGHAHYLGKVMRVQPGDVVVLCDDKTGEWAANVTEAGKRAVTVKVAKKLREREIVPDFWLCPALLKKDRFDMVLEKATELGVCAIKPVVTRRCVANKLNEERARAITVEAAEQCARTALPEVDKVQKLSALLDAWPDNRTIFFADELGGSPAAETFSATSGPCGLITGPEGGFDDAERELLRAHPKVKPITLGPRILRGETAAIAAVSLWMGIAGDWRSDEQQ